MNEKKLKKPELGYDDDDLENMFQDYFKQLNGADSLDDTDASLEAATAEQDDNDTPLPDTARRSLHKAGQPVMPIQLAITIGSDDETEGYADGPATVRIRTSDDVLPSPSRFRCHIYTADYYLMCTSEEQCNVSRDDCELTYEIRCHNIWMTGLYYLLVCDEQYVTARMPFIIDDNLQLCYESAEYADCLSADDMLASCVGSSRHWQRLASMPGTRQLRQKILEAEQLALYNEVRKNLDGEPLEGNANYIICTLNDDLKERHLDDFSKALRLRQELQYVDCSTLYDAACNNPYEHLGELLGSLDGQTICLTNLGALLSTGGKTIVRRLLAEVRRHNPPLPLWLCGSHQEVKALMEQFPSLKEHFRADSYLMQEPYTDFELVQAFFSCLRQEHLEPAPEVKNLVTKAIIDSCRQGRLTNWTLADIRRVVTDDIRPRYLKRAIQNLDFESLPPLSIDDIDLSLLSGGDTFEESLGQLNAMVGLDEVKQGVTTMANSSRFSLERRRRGLHTSPQPAFHCIFTGNPGTGKTTVARQLGRIYHALGLLSRGEVVAVDRTRLVGRYIGETEENMKAVLEEARGNVLFIDEAYNLYDGSGDRKDFGARVIDALLTVLSQPHPDMLVIFAGYEKEMDAMLNTNPGLSGRFPYKYRFADYTAEQLMQIATRLLQRDDYILSDNAASELRASIAHTISHRTPNFANARWVEQFIRNGILPAMADRLAATASDDYQTIEDADVRRAYERFNPRATELKPRHEVGFSV